MCDTEEIVRRLEEFLRKSLSNCEEESTGFNTSSLVENVFSAFLNNNSFFRSQNLYEDNFGNGSSASGNMSTILGGEEGIHPPINKLELIKVVVLIVVILIILLTTCRMVFQLSTRFRPEKPNAQD